MKGGYSLLFLPRKNLCLRSLEAEGRLLGSFWRQRDTKSLKWLLNLRFSTSSSSGGGFLTTIEKTCWVMLEERGRGIGEGEGKEREGDVLVRAHSQREEVFLWLVQVLLFQVTISFRIQRKQKKKHYVFIILIIFILCYFIYYIYFFYLLRYVHSIVIATRLTSLWPSA